MIGPDSKKNIDALKKADWLVVCEIYPDETSEFWQSPGITPEEMKKHPDHSLPPARRGVRRKGRHVRQLGALAAMEECRAAAAGRCRLDQEILAQIFLKVRELYQKEGGKFPDPILNLTWTYTIPTIPRWPKSRRRSTARRWPTSPTRKRNRRSRPASNCRHLPGCATTARRRAATGSTADRWTEAGPLMQRAAPKIRPGSASIRTGPGRWPVNRRVLYNRASCDVEGKPWDPDRRQVWWNENAQKWIGQRRSRFQSRLEAEGSHGAVHHESGRSRAGSSCRLA